MSETIDLPRDPSELLVHLRESLENTSLTQAVYHFYAQRATEAKDQIDHLAAEIQLRQERMRLINELISSINAKTDNSSSLDLTGDEELQEMLRLAKELGAKVDPEKLTYTAAERDRLVENLHLKGDEWDKENRTQTQQMEIQIKNLDRIIMLMKEVQKGEDRTKRNAAAGIKGG